jgi:hypothetical protein
LSRAAQLIDAVREAREHGFEIWSLEAYPPRNRKSSVARTPAIIATLKPRATPTRREGSRRVIDVHNHAMQRVAGCIPRMQNGRRVEPDVICYGQSRGTSALTNHFKDLSLGILARLCELARRAAARLLRAQHRRGHALDDNNDLGCYRLGKGHALVGRRQSATRSNGLAALERLDSDEAGADS